MDKRLNSLELLGEAMDVKRNAKKRHRIDTKRNAKKRHRLALLSEAMDMKSIAWRYSVKQWHIFEKSRKAKEMKANEIYSLRQNSGESKTEIHTSRYCIYTQKNSRV